MENNERVFYHYRVKWYYDSKPTFSEGFLFAYGVSEAAAIIDESFDCIDEVKLSAICDGRLLDFEDLLDYLQGEYNINKALGPQVYEAIQNAIEVKE